MMIKHTIAVLFFTCGFLTAVNSQSLSPVVVSSGGGFFSASSGSLSFTIGEAAVATHTTTGAILTEGFQQTWKFGTKIKTEESGTISIGMFPNPAQSFLEFVIQCKEAHSVQIELYNSLGQLITTIDANSESSSDFNAVYDVTQLADGVYTSRICVQSGAGIRQYFNEQFIINK